MTTKTTDTKELRKRWNRFRKEIEAMREEYIAGNHEIPAYAIYGETYMFSAARKSATVRVGHRFVKAYLRFEAVASFIEDTGCTVEVDTNSMYEGLVSDMIRFVF